jgi:hypothetical protein
MDVLAQLVKLPRAVDFAILNRHDAPVFSDARGRGEFLSEILMQMDKNSLPLFYFLMKQPAEMFSNRRYALDSLLMKGRRGMLRVLLQIPEYEFKARGFDLHYLLAYRSFHDPELLAELLELTPHSIIDDRQGALDTLASVPVEFHLPLGYEG